MITEGSGIKAIQLIWNVAGYGQYVITNKLDAGKFITLCIPLELFEKVQAEKVKRTNVEIGENGKLKRKSTKYSSE